MINYNEKALTEEGSCPDFRVYGPKILEQIGLLTKQALCVSSEEQKQYTDEKIQILQNVLDSLGDTTGLQEKITKINEILTTLDPDGDGTLNEILDLKNNLETLQTQFTTLQTQNNLIQTDVTNLKDNKEFVNNKITDLTNDIELLKADQHQEKICDFSRNLVQGLEAGLAKFKEALMTSCDLVDSKITGSESSSSSSSSESSSSESSSSESSSSESSSSESTDESSSEEATDTTADSPII